MVDIKLTNAKIDGIIKRLKQGLMGNHHRVTMQASKELLELNTDVSPRLLKELEKLQLTGEIRSEIVNLATGLAIIAYDLNENTCREYLEALLKQDCNRAIASAFTSILRYRMSDYRKSRFGEITILEEKSINKRHQATTRIVSWLEGVPQKDLQGISRIYVMKDKSIYDFAGQYSIYFNVVTVVWYTQFHPYNPIQAFNFLFSEKTLYHEIGHHCLDHREFGQDPEQEKEANAYAYKLLGKSHPWLVKSARLLKPVVRLIDRFGG